MQSFEKITLNTAFFIHAFPIKNNFQETGNIIVSPSRRICMKSSIPIGYESKTTASNDVVQGNMSTPTALFTL